MGNAYSRAAAYDYINASLKRMFREQDREKQNFKSNPPLPTLKEYFFMGVKHCLELANAGNVKAKKHLPEIFFRLALYYENGNSEYGVIKNLKKANEYLELAINLESEQIEEKFLCA
ncbi:MAG: hypothetical protein IJQ85_05640 [Selenomonadaceae bacterium]|nr:hypothetical protein [Selenomonadaceae bacterium]